MKESFIKFQSVTQALKAQKILKKFNIKSELTRIYNNKSTNGCGYKLTFNTQVQQVKKILVKNKIPFVD